MISNKGFSMSLNWPHDHVTKRFHRAGCSRHGAAVKIIQFVCRIPVQIDFTGATLAQKFSMIDDSKDIIWAKAFSGDLTASY